jgi:hypothetical protein
LKSKFKERGVNHYSKADSSIYDVISKDVHIARARAKKMNTATLSAATQGKDAPYLLNPYTNVYELLDAIDAFVK